MPRQGFTLWPSIASEASDSQQGVDEGDEEKMIESPTDVEGIKKATGEGFRKHISEYSHEIIAIPTTVDDEHKYARYQTDELTSVCPLTGLPDFYDCTIELVPYRLVPELKTLKFYLAAYRDVGVLHEDLAPKILKDINEKIDPFWIRVTLVAASRGGINTTVVYELGDKDLAPERN
jgi:7-cyano-7-deazaguanine reductase